MIVITVRRSSGAQFTLTADERYLDAILERCCEEFGSPGDHVDWARAQAIFAKHQEKV